MHREIVKQPVNNASSSTRAPLRVGLLIDSFVQRKWIHKVIEEIQASGFAEVTVVIKNEASTSAPKQGRLKSYWRNRKYLLYALYEKFDERRVKVNPNAFEPTDIKSLLSDCPVINVTPTMKAYSDWFPEEALKQIREYDLDVALSFGFRILKGDVLKIARHGIWSFHHGDNFINRGGPAGFWEVMDGVPVTGSVLQVLTEDLDNGQIIYRSWSPTSDRFSVKANRNNLYWKSCAFVIRKLRDLSEGQPVSTPESQVYAPYSNRLFRMPTNSEMFSRLSRLGAKYGAGKVQSALSTDQWALAYRFRSGPHDTNNTLYRFKNLVPPKDRFWADPCAIEADGRYYVFLEEYLNETAKGHISVMELDRKGVVSGPTKVLDRGYHLSYPFVFEWNRNYYMVPESAANKTVELYRSTSFPFAWGLEKVLLTDVRAKDATLAEVDGTWWMFVSIAEHSIPDELYLFSAETPLGPWTPHRRNPVKSDVRGSRPAGGLFNWNEDLYRPAQNSSGRYGYAISINRVTQLDHERFSEEKVSEILPNWDRKLLGTHTISIAGDLTVIDCLMKRSRWVLSRKENSATDYSGLSAQSVESVAETQLTTKQRRRKRKLLKWLLLFIAVWSILAWLGARALIVSAPLASADAIVVLSGSSAYLERTQKAAELYREGRAPLILLTDDHTRGGWSSAQQRNPFFVERATEELIKAGIPDDRIRIVPGVASSTHSEAVLIKDYAAAHGLRSVLVVTSAYHSRRALRTLRQVFAGTETVVGLDPAPIVSLTPSPVLWWLQPEGWRTVGGEFVKLIYYWFEYR